MATNKELRKIHGHDESDLDSLSGISEFDEEYEKIRPPPIPYSQIRNRVIVIPALKTQQSNTQVSNSLSTDYNISGNSIIQNRTHASAQTKNINSINSNSLVPHSIIINQQSHDKQFKNPSSISKIYNPYSKSHGSTSKIINHQQYDSTNGSFEDRSSISTVNIPKPKSHGPTSKTTNHQQYNTTIPTFEDRSSISTVHIPKPKSRGSTSRATNQYFEERSSVSTIHIPKSASRISTRRTKNHQRNDSTNRSIENQSRILDSSNQRRTSTSTVNSEQVLCETNQEDSGELCCCSIS